MHDPRWCLFFDFHTMPACPDVGKGFDFDRITDEIRDMGVDYVVFPARCNLGMAYYNTEIGIRHPSLDCDLLGSLVKACHRRGIALTSYLNVGLSHEEGLRNRGWLVLPESGETYRQDRLNSFFRQMCYNTEYGDHITAMAREVVEKCGVDGIFLDCLHTLPCVGHECIRKMKEEGVDWRDAEQLHDFNYRKIVAMTRRIVEEARKVNPDLLVYCNGVDYEAQADIGTYLEFECLPTGGWGYELLPVGSRYLRTLGKPVLNMTGRFHRSWGDFGGIRTEPALEYDCLYGIANGMRSTIGDHFHPRGDINRAVFDMDARIYKRLRMLDPWIDGARPLTDTALVWLKPYPGYKYRTPGRMASYTAEFNAVKAATRALCEVKIQFDVVSHYADWNAYRLLVLPDFVTMDDETRRRIRLHLDRGGAILSTGWSGLDPAKSDFVFREWGIDYAGESPFDPAFLVPEGSFSEGMPDMPVTLYDRGISVTARDKTEVLARITAPYYNRHWDGEHGFVYIPPDRPTDQPAVTLRGQVGHATHPLFTTYHNHAPVPIRQVLANLLTRLLPEPLIRAPGAASFARVTVTGQPGRRIVHILSYVPEQRGANANMIEEPIELRDFTLMLRADGRAPREVYLAPRRESLPFEVSGNYLKTTVPAVTGYATVVFEE